MVRVYRSSLHHGGGASTWKNRLRWTGSAWRCVTRRQTAGALVMRLETRSRAVGPEIVRRQRVFCCEVESSDPFRNLLLDVECSG
jgi:hypothetical protein